MVDVLGPGSLFGLIPALDGGPYVAQLEAMTQVRVVCATRESLLEEMREHPDVAANLINQVAGFARNDEKWLINTL